MKRTYTTNAGDMWDLIALKTLGSEYDMDLLIDANPTYRETVIFSSGIVLHVPEEKKETEPDH
ncbi:tail protein X, partial [Lactobacillus crispatus]|uniref:tail protein X n=1 Tax=Lactobacillus crispatus TaxID=47770 RepID=UPI0029C3F015